MAVSRLAGGGGSMKGKVRGSPTLILFIWNENRNSQEWGTHGPLWSIWQGSAIANLQYFKTPNVKAHRADTGGTATICLPAQHLFSQTLARERAHDLS